MLDDIEVVGTSQSAIKAFEMLKSLDVDLVFLDIRMPVLNGIDFIKILKNPPYIILTTAYREYALDGYDLDIIDYLLKPISFDRFLKAIDRYQERIGQTPITTAISNSTPPSTQYIFFNVNKTHHKVAVDSILYIESLKDYVRVHTDNERLVVKGNIGSTMKLLPSELFLRVHRSFAIAKQHLTSFNQSEVTVAGIKLPIGKSYRKTVIEALKS